MNKVVKITVPALIALAVCACGQKKPAQDPMMMGMGDQIPKVETYAASFQEVPQEEVYSSTVQAYAINNVVPQSGNRIARVYVEVGDFVSRGQVLAEMDAVGLNQAALKLANDSTELARLRGLFLAGGISQSDFEAVELAYKVSKSSYDNLLENTVLRAPMGGVITARNYDSGDMYAMASPIYVVQQITPVKILVGISETDYTRIKKGDTVLIDADALPGRTFEGKVNRLYPTIDPATHTFTAEILVTNSDRVLRPGMYVRVKVTFAVNHSIVIPDSAVIKQQGSGQRSVYLLQPDNTVKSVVVTLGRHFDQNYEILDGLKEGDIVVTKGHSALRDGSQVTL
ncbi:MAG: efflux RND transporter periplasmic adaptor subunit [Bacteroidales bacterium]|nr:efflux RND transporter periplasmic adaptor subunit [Bacteroidales bacterium]MBP5795622.1 efflux RND transporter periplasmic adaptor subunit [Bacteroidales bacterium]